MADIIQPIFNDELRDIIENSERYEDFKLLDHPVKFKDLFADMNISYVQLHSTQIIKSENYKDIVGFCGVFEWKDNKIESLDYDSYSEDVFVYGYEWFDDADGDRCLDVLVGENW